MNENLLQIPGVGKTTKDDLIRLGYFNISSLKGANPMEMYRQTCKIQNCQVDRCVLYVYRCAVYYAETKNPDPEKLKWWYWKDYMHPNER